MQVKIIVNDILRYVTKHLTRLCYEHCAAGNVTVSSGFDETANPTEIGSKKKKEKSRVRETTSTGGGATVWLGFWAWTVLNLARVASSATVVARRRPTGHFDAEQRFAGRRPSTPLLRYRADGTSTATTTTRRRPHHRQHRDHQYSEETDDHRAHRPLIVLRSSRSSRVRPIVSYWFRN